MTQILEAGIGGLFGGLFIAAFFFIPIYLFRFFKDKINVKETKEAVKQWNSEKMQEKQIIKKKLTTKEKLKELKKLYEKNIITFKNYEEQQKKILEEDE